MNTLGFPTMTPAEESAWVAMAKDGTLALALTDDHYKYLLQQRVEQQRKERRALV